MLRLRQCGVYKIANVNTGAFYIGSSNFLERRFGVHKTALRGNRHQNKHLQSSWNKHGEATFAFETLLICSEADMRFYEQLVMDAWGPNYNQSKSAYAGVPLGAKLSDAHKEKVGQASAKHWKDESYRTKVTDAINAAMTSDECNARSERTKQLWANPEYRTKAVAVRKGNAYSKGYKCTEVQIKNRQRAARISNMKRNYDNDWKSEYAIRYSEHIGDLNAY